MPNSEMNKNINEESMEDTVNTADAAGDISEETAHDGSGSEASDESAASAQDVSASKDEDSECSSESETNSDIEDSSCKDADGATGCETGTSAGAEGKAGGREEKKERKFFKKKEKKDKKDEKIEELTDKLTRQMAEFDNYRKRTDKEKAANYIVGAKEVIEKLLPVVDNFERGLAGADDSDPFVDGMNKIYKQLTQMLTDIGVTPIEAVGKEFDPNFHNAVMHIDDEELGENIIAEEFQKGYMYKNQIVRHSMVKVAN